MRRLSELSMPAVSALVGAIAMFIMSALLGAPNAGIAIAFFVAFFAASGLHVLMRGRASPDRSWRMRSIGTPAAICRQRDRHGDSTLR